MLIAAFLLRLGMAVAVQTFLDRDEQRQYVIEGDADGYWRLGQAVAAGEPYAIYDPPRRVMRMPGFPLLLAIPIQFFPGQQLPARLFLAGIGSLACGLVYLLGCELFDEPVGVLAGWIIAVSPAAVGFSVMILSETPFALGITGSLWAMLRLLREIDTAHPSRKIWGWALATGGFIAFSTDMRPSWLPAAIVFPLGLLVWGRAQWKVVVPGLVIIGTVALALWPWAMRNHRVTGHWVITTLWSGPSLYDGLNPHATGASEMSFFDRDNLSARMSESEVNQHYWQAGWDYARNHPWRALELGLIKSWRFWKPWPSAAESGNWITKTGIACFSLFLFAGSLYGMWLYRNRLDVLLLTLGPVLFFSVLHAIFVGSLRYRLPAEYPMSVLAAAGWLDVCRRVLTTRKLQGAQS